MIPTENPTTRYSLLAQLDCTSQQREVLYLSQPIMFNTIELRWFYPGALPSAVLAWFDRVGAPLNSPDRRADIYLQPVTVDVGVKLRQGNLELKYRQEHLGKLQIGDNFSGEVELWSKWICPDDIPDRLTPARIGHRQGWLRVEKVRYQRLYRVEFQEQTCLLTAISTPEDRAAAIEVTELQFNGDSWWTIACEYLGSDLQLEPKLQLLVSSLLQDCPLPLTPLSCGYPQWLLRSKK